MDSAGWILEKSSLLIGKLGNLTWNSNKKPYVLGGEVVVRQSMMSLLHVYSLFRLSDECVGVLIEGGKDNNRHTTHTQQKMGEDGTELVPAGLGMTAEETTFQV